MLSWVYGLVKQNSEKIQKNRCFWPHEAGSGRSPRVSVTKNAKTNRKVEEVEEVPVQNLVFLSSFYFFDLFDLVVNLPLSVSDTIFRNPAGRLPPPPVFR
jgi:hypothetical protein